MEAIEELQPASEVAFESRLPALLSIDIGTSGVRAALFDECGADLPGQSIRIDSNDASLADSGAVDADFLLAQVSLTLDRFFAEVYDPVTRIELIAVSCFWHSLVGIDDANRPTTKLYGWSDLRSKEAAKRLREQHDERRFHARTGCRFHPSYWPARLMRLRTDEPEVFSTTSQWLSFADYLALQWFGEIATSVSMASGTGLLDQHTCEWDRELTRIAGITLDNLPPIASDSYVFINLKPEYSSRWPQLRGARMFPAIADGAANNIGAGCTTREKAALMIGTSGAMRILYRGSPPEDLPSELWCYRADRKRVIVGGALSDGGSLYRWIRETWLTAQDATAIEAELGLLNANEHGLTILPFWSGERSTGWNADARGAIDGLTSKTRPIEVLRAAMEAVAYRFALIARALESLAPDASVLASGNALQSSPVWVQILADVLGRSLHVSNCAEASTRGAALLALEAAGKIPDIENFSVPIDAAFEPDSSRHARYQLGLARQQELYAQLVNGIQIRTVK